MCLYVWYWAIRVCSDFLNLFFWLILKRVRTRILSQILDHYGIQIYWISLKWKIKCGFLKLQKVVEFWSDFGDLDHNSCFELISFHCLRLDLVLSRQKCCNIYLSLIADRHVNLLCIDIDSNGCKRQTTPKRPHVSATKPRHVLLR